MAREGTMGGGQKEGIRRVLATCCHTNLCIPKLGAKNKTPPSSCRLENFVLLIL